MSGQPYYYDVSGRAFGPVAVMTWGEAEKRNRKLEAGKHVGRWKPGDGSALAIITPTVPDVVIDANVPSDLPATLYAVLLGQYEVVELDRNYKSIPMWKAKDGQIVRAA
jgi:hypothetical protein